jgi:hypothetical protein
MNIIPIILAKMNIWYYFKKLFIVVNVVMCFVNNKHFQR